MESLSVRYRPNLFEEALGQDVTIHILKRQLEMGKISNCYLFTGPSGCGKTTLARIFAKKINNGEGEPIEIDGASNNGVENVRNIIDDAKTGSWDSEYKIYIIDECHAITTAGWQAFLKCIEEPPKKTIFMFCTTDPQKIPDTIKGGRTMKFSLTRVPANLIEERLKSICYKEGFTNYDEACNYLSKICNGSVRDSISKLEKCSMYSTDLSLDNCLKALGAVPITSMFNITNAIIDGNEASIYTEVENFYNQGNDLKLFIDQYLDFALDLNKYCLLKTMNNVKIPTDMEQNVKYTTGISDNVKYFSKFVNKILELKNMLKQDNSVKTTIEIFLTNMARGI